jgi:hypothetical protein
VFPAALIDRFVRVRQSMIEEIRAAEAQRVKEAERLREAERRRELAERVRLEDLERLAMQETVITRRERWVAAMPYGVGQFQNGDDGLGWLFLGTEALLTAVVIGGIAVELENYSKQEDPALDPADIERNANTARDVWVSGLYALLAVAGGGILQAQLAFEPQTISVRQRRLPPHLQPKPPSQSRLQLLPAADLSSNSLGLNARFRF